MFTAWPVYNTHIPTFEIHTKPTVFHFSTCMQALTLQYSYKYENIKKLQLMINLALSKEQYINENNIPWLHLVESHKLGSQCNQKHILHVWHCNKETILSSRGQLKCDGTRAETRFRLSAKRTSPFKSRGGGGGCSAAHGPRGGGHGGE